MLSVKGENVKQISVKSGMPSQYVSSAKLDNVSLSEVMIAKKESVWKETIINLEK